MKKKPWILFESKAWFFSKAERTRKYVSILKPIATQLSDKIRGFIFYFGFAEPKAISDVCFWIVGAVFIRDYPLNRGWPSTSSDGPKPLPPTPNYSLNNIELYVVSEEVSVTTESWVRNTAGNRYHLHHPSLRAVGATLRSGGIGSTSRKPGWTQAGSSEPRSLFTLISPTGAKIDS
jgi:hypothetical protein